ncbi:MAG: hypothetical protein LBR23_10025 [Spirochaetaceae bacterium]|jgi:hypothetical protein|nr:hypothetical protein [Spirochaetaceae bacterium]
MNEEEDADDFPLPKEYEEADFEALVREITELVAALDEHNLEGLRIDAMSPAEWEANMDYYKKIYTWGDEDVDKDWLKKFVLFNILHEEPEQLEGELDMAITALEKRFHKTAKIESGTDGASIVEIVDMGKDEEHSYHYDGRIVPLEKL